MNAYLCRLLNSGTQFWGFRKTPSMPWILWNKSTVFIPQHNIQIVIIFP